MKVKVNSIRAIPDKLYDAKRLKNMTPKEVSIATDNDPIFEPDDIFVDFGGYSMVYMCDYEIEIVEEDEANE